ncbi:MAG: Fe-S cluster assembly protein SufD [Candidatus Binatia bacterium]
MQLKTAKELEHYLSDFDQFEKNGAAQEPSWLRQLRQSAISRFVELGFPTIRHEEWKYTSVAPIARSRFQPAASERNGLTAQTLAHVSLAEVARTQLVFVNGHYSQELSSTRSLPEGVQVESLATVLHVDPARAEPHLAQYANYQDHSFVALNTAFMEDGAFVYVPKGIAVEVPIHLLFVSTALTVNGQPTVSHPRNLIVIDDDSQAMIVESYLGGATGGYFTNAVSEILAGENTVLAHYKLEQESDAAFHIATTQAYLSRNCNFVSQALALGGALVRNDVNAVLAGEGSECTLDGLYMTTGQQHVDTHTRVDHVQPHCSSRELYKGILDGKSKGVFNGKIYVHKDAQKTDAKQANKNLLLSEDAVINTKPQLEIYADDVKCTHGSTIGQLDQDAIFYLRSRGIGPEAARGLLTYAFASEMISRIKVEPLRARLNTLLMTRL